ncbi:hypothetical protein MKS88_001176 [Plasmodium brasilianum]|uniref:Uncharacterized protein n=1 Tax=Plasmodium brasilianum TaxID=5824 RepID=A0ACB9YDI8_PLABR|nr:hypothetical protein MKS88_001176 [Plasmodium brasilianum]
MRLLRTVKHHGWYLIICDTVRHNKTNRNYPIVVLKRFAHIFSNIDSLQNGKAIEGVVKREEQNNEGAHYNINGKSRYTSGSVHIQSGNYYNIETKRGEGDKTQLRAIPTADNKTKGKIEHLLCTYKSRKLHDTVLEILTVINNNGKNKDIYINKNILLPFYNILVKRKYYLNNLKSHMYDDYCTLNIFDYIHYNINVHLKQYNLKNVHHLLSSLSKYVHKNKPNKITNELIANIFYFSFFTHFNKYNYAKRNRYYNDVQLSKSRNEEKEKASTIDKVRNQENSIASTKENTRLHKYDHRNDSIEQYYNNNVVGGNSLSMEENYFEKDGLKFSADSNLVSKKKRIILYSDSFPKKAAQNKLIKYDRCYNEEQTFVYLNSYIVFLSNHPTYITNEKIMYNISLLAKNITQFEINPIIALSFLSASLNVFHTVEKKKMGGKRTSSLFIHTKTNYYILYCILKDLNEKIRKNRIQNNNDEVDTHGMEIHREHQTNGKYPQTSDKVNDNSCYTTPNEAKGKCVKGEKDYLNLWYFSHIIHVIKILKIENFISLNFEFSKDAEKCVTDAFIHMIFHMSNYISNFQNGCTLNSQNDLNSFVSIYVNISTLLNELTKFRNIFNVLLTFLNDSYKIIHIQYNNLHVNMMINLVRGMYSQISTYSKENSYELHFGKLHKLHKLFTCSIKVKQVDPFLNNNSEIKTLVNILNLVQNVSLCILIPYKEKEDVELSKLITMLHYLHKINKIFLSFNENSVLDIPITKYLKHIERKFCIPKKGYKNLAHYHILLFLNLHLYYYNCRGINLSLLKNCFAYLEEKDSHLFINETEVIMFLNFFSKLMQIKENVKRKNDIFSLFKLDHFKNTQIGGKGKKVLSNMHQLVVHSNRVEDDNIFHSMRQYVEHSTLSDIMNIFVKKYLNRIIHILFFQNWVQLKKNLVLEYNTSFLNTQPKIKNTKLEFPSTVCSSNMNSMNMPFFPLMKYSLNVYFMTYESVYSNYPYNEAVKGGVLLNLLNNMIKYKRNKLNGENFFFIISCLLKAKMFRHEVYYMYYKLLSTNLQQWEMPYVFYIMRRIFEETADTDVMNSKGVGIHGGNSSSNSSSICSGNSSSICSSNSSSICSGNSSSICSSNSSSICSSNSSSICSSINSSNASVDGDVHRNNAPNDDVLSDPRGRLHRMGINSLIVRAIVELSSKIILNDKNYINNFNFFKEVLHVYFEKYEKLSLTYKRFNYFVLSYLNNFTKCNKKECEKNLIENKLVMLINNAASFLYTINKYSNKTKKNEKTDVKEKERNILHVHNTKKKDEKPKYADNVYDLKKEHAHYLMECIRHTKSELPPIISASSSHMDHINCTFKRSNTETNDEHRVQKNGAELMKNVQLHKSDDTYSGNCSSSYSGTHRSNERGSYDEEHLKNKLTKLLQKLLCILYINKMKNKMQHEIELTSRNIIDILISLKNCKLRYVNIIQVLSKKYIENIFTQKSSVKTEYQLKFFNTIIFLDYFKEANNYFEEYILNKTDESYNDKLHHQGKPFKRLKPHILYSHFLKMPIMEVIYASNISTYLLNFVSFLDYVDIESQKRVCSKVKTLIQILLKMHCTYDQHHNPHNHHSLANKLVKRNIFILFTLLNFAGPSFDISSLHFESLNIFYNNFILNYFPQHTNMIQSSSTHQNVFEFLTNFLEKYSHRYEVHNEKHVHLFNVDIVLVILRKL